MSNSLWLHGLYSPWNSPGQNTGVGSLSLLQGIFPTQELNPGLHYCRQILYQLSHRGSPRILERVAYPFSSRPSPPRNQTRVCCIADGFFTSWLFSGKESVCNVGDPGLIPGWGISPGVGNGNPLQYSFLENSMDRGAWQAIVCGVAKSWTGLSDFHFTSLLYQMSY